MATGLNDGVSENIGRIRREIHKDRSPHCDMSGLVRRGELLAFGKAAPARIWINAQTTTCTLHRAAATRTEEQ